MRLIDADTLIADYIVSGTTTNKPVKRYISEESISYAPTIEAEPVRHDRWRPIGNSGFATCGCSFMTSRWSVYKFCPLCGAKMDGGGAI